MIIFNVICGIVVGLALNELLFHAEKHTDAGLLGIATAGVFVVVMAVLSNIL